MATHFHGPTVMAAQAGSRDFAWAEVVDARLRGHDGGGVWRMDSA